MILVTGAGGTVGSELVKRLAAAGVPFRAGFSTADKAEWARRAGFAAVHANFAEPATLREALAGVDALFVLSGWSPRQSDLEIALVQEAARAGVRRLVKLSVWEADQEAFSFARIHRRVEQAIEASGIPWTFLRPNGFMQNLSNFLAASIRGTGAFHMPAARARISHVDVRDIAETARIALTRPGHEGKTYDLSGPEALTWAEIAARLSGVLGRKIAYVPVGEEDYRRGAVAAGIPEPYADALVDLTRYYASGGAARVSPDVARVTGRDPASFDTFARDHAQLFG